MPHGLHVVLVEPEIPQNTGNIGRLCLATGSTLHLIEPMGFEITHSRLKRAGLDYWEHLKVQIHPGIDEFIQALPKDAPKVFFSKKAGRTIYEHRFVPGTYLFFGKETMGLPDSIVNAYAADSVRIPMYDARVRSLNLANSVGIAIYEAIRQLGA
ncbi:MAG: tRNA (uridine(34)/cytosine(34)/5-carboxymethylaminomethyluridine(34)-2'-O)-methyltransferase TrmL [Bdellovibrionales bacterium GWC1_52_8]|nr:MAG: tRNA (uridine(34)/cytosine(34)/5-carboxymethylaminomethyluridine(34)-2'-O)-methyltransferase TrmL [Bdellovibrionales bacterium GWB1_52_6]OFZ05785.1 MAG: tRNA (uridine(34)/cytosine(34)/5-carboxymethylaminomethyluridine(34)-2'-O)-methyltransferase TrmL [Bdellovibrionales bacterium GWA1_52_35]OFZ43687.1 MAG: tRNA (uridine(34)/cytosine(34)/5-carboxymethylaminomethyluridine(34)-2'-O)-methyltransferase TrmL [Bdellovibrionales bacterium GWC1_52_8]HCM40274.1 tRNA (uridine(34)/cytosine(34)/5-carb